jgi:outer membrane protein assembly factor BamE (lipoprotein component of BamABCDE complex)
MRARIFGIKAGLAVGVVAGLLLITTGCQHSATSAVGRPASDHLMVGMYAEQVRTLLGEPAEIVIGTGDDQVQETWTYVIQHRPTYRNVVAEMRSVPWVDPITGEMKTISEPINDQQRIDREETLTLVLRYDQLISIDRDLREQRTFSR